MIAMEREFEYGNRLIAGHSEVAADSDHERDAAEWCESLIADIELDLEAENAPKPL